MSKAAFLYLEGEEQVAALEALLPSCQAWLAQSNNTSAAAPAVRLRVIVENPDEVRFCWLDEAGPLASWPIGRVFGDLGDLTWRREDELTHVVLITDAGTLPPPFAATGLDLAPLAGPLLDQVRLWGEKQAAGDWLEGRIPTPLSYPLVGTAAGSRATLLIKRYGVAGQGDTGFADFVRCADLV